jgi:peptidoglycan-associated lipoprotein
MKHSVAGRNTVLALLVSVIFFSGCHKRAATASTAQSPAPASTPATPMVTLQASPATIAPGGSSTLTWSSSNATQVQLSPEIGDVSVQGSRSVTPNQSTVYTVRATGPGGTATASASITLSSSSNVSAPQPTAEELFQRNVGDVYFDYDKAQLASSSRDILTRDGDFFRNHPEMRFTIEGHCDERGGEEYNLGLGARRADAAKQFLLSLGLRPDQIQTVSYGKERPFCSDENESCFHQNRRDHFVMSQ